MFAWHERPGAFERLIPPWQHVRVLDRHGGIADGGEVTIRLRIAGMPVKWIAKHQDYIKDRQFVDVQVRGPFAHWAHTHRIEPIGDEACELLDLVTYQLPGSVIGQALGHGMVRRQLQRVFEYRHEVTKQDIDAHQREAEGRRFTVAITGTHGLIGRALVPFLTTGGHTVKAIVRGKPTDETQISWSPKSGEVDAEKLEGVDAVVHLAGEPILGRWSKEKKRRIYDSRVQGTQQIADALAKLKRPPRVLVNASAIGYYGSRGDEVLDETSAVGRGFLAEVAADWERATQPAENAGIRVVKLRIGAVLTPEGGGARCNAPGLSQGAGRAVE